MRTERRLVGRTAEAGALRRAARAAARGRGRFVIVTGEAGAGKTALVDRALAGSALLVLRGSATAGAAVSLAPIVDAVRSHPDWPAVGRSALDAGWKPFLLPLFPELATGPGPAGADADPGDDARTQPEAVRRLIVAIARARAVALVVDDLQRADAATLALLLDLAPAAGREPLLVVAAYRSDEMPHASPVRHWRRELARATRADEIAVLPLPDDAVATLAARTLGGRPDPALAAWLADRSAGLPLFVEELAAALRAEGAVRPGPAGVELARPDLPLPANLREAVLVRLDGLPPGTRQALAIAALAADPIRVALVDDVAAEVLGPDRGVPGEWLRRGVERGVLTELAEGAAAFRHDLVREALDGDLDGTTRRAAHAAIAARLTDAAAQPLVVAGHWLAGGEPRRAAASLVAAADASCRIRAYRDAAAALRRAIEVGPPPGLSNVEVRERLAECAELSGDVGEAAELWERAATERADTGEPVRAAEDARRQASLLELRGRWERAVEARRSAARWFGLGGRSGDAAAEHLAAAAHLRSAAAFTAARELLSTALDEARTAGRLDLEARIVGLDGNVLTRMGHGEEGVARVRRGLELALGGGLSAPAAELYQRLADSLEHAGLYGRARSTYLEGADYCRRQSIEPSAQLCLACLGVVLFQTGEWSVAERTCRDVIGSGQATPHALAVAEGVLGIVAAMRGTTSRARPHLHASLALARHIELAAMELIALWGLAVCDRADGQAVDAAARCRELLGRWERTEERHYSVPLLRWAATVHAAGGDGAATRACAAALAQMAADTGQPEAVAALGAALGEAALLDGSASAAVEHLTSALELVTARDLPIDRAEIGWRAGVALVRAGRRADGVTALVTAHRTAQRLGAMPLAAAIAAELRELGEPLERRLGRRATVRLASGGLTVRELDVLRLVAAGHTSRSIGETLFISPRTAEMHVSSAIAKLDCRTRAEAAHRAAELGLFATAPAVPGR